MKNKFVVIEGIDGSGKSTTLKLLNNIYKRMGINSLFEFEPTKNHIGKIARGQTVDFNQGIKGASDINKNLHDLCLCVSDRIDHMYNSDYGVVHKECDLVLMDRYHMSSTVYNVDKNRLLTSVSRNLHKELPMPDLTIYFDIEPKIAHERLHSRQHKVHESETLEHLTGLHKNYAKEVEYNSESSFYGKLEVIEVSDDVTIEDMVKNVYRAIGAGLDLWHSKDMMDEENFLHIKFEEALEQEMFAYYHNGQTVVDKI